MVTPQSVSFGRCWLTGRIFTALIQVVHNVTFSNQPPGSLVKLYVEMRLGELKDSTLTSFRIWR
jgi:hypothetical protein